jgi:protein gp37
MAGASDIEWTDATWNPVSGCTVISPGCTNCYAMRMAGRLSAMGLPKYKGTTRKSGRRTVWTGKLKVDYSTFDAPLRWRKPRMIFVNSMSDLFHEAVPMDVAHEVWDIMESATQHTFQVLTKRPERMAQFLAQRKTSLPNVWIGTSVESQAYVHRLDAIRDCPAAVRFVSFEPLLGPIKSPNLHGYSWVIVGGESGPNSRSIDPRWVKSLLRATKSQGASFFFKQWGGPNKKRTGRLLEGREWLEFPRTQNKNSPRIAA